MSVMIRETLEMIPVAILLAVILAFGAESGRMRSLRLDRVIDAKGVAPLLAVAAVNESAPIAGRGSRILDGDSARTPAAVPPSEEPSPALVRGAGPGLFIDWKTRHAGVPAFTSADIPRSGRPARAENSSPYEETSEPHDPGSLIRINHANADALTRIPGIGPARAQAVLDRRPRGGYRNWAEIDALPGFGDGTVMMMKLHAVLD
jgi:hypothetical protein